MLARTPTTRMGWIDQETILHLRRLKRRSTVMFPRMMRSILILGFFASPTFAADAPTWLRLAASAATSSYEERSPAVVLIDEERVDIDRNGRMRTSKIYAVKIFSSEARSTAVARALYRTDTGRVRRLRAWLIDPSNELIEYEEEDLIDIALVGNDVYNEARLKVIDASNDARPGVVFGYEAETEDRSIFTQFEHQFQTRLPVITARLVLTLPEDWHADSVTFSHTPVEPNVVGSTYTWQLHDLQYVVPEPASPRLSSLVPRLAVSFFPSEEDIARTGPTFSSWGDVSRWLSSLNDPQAVADTAIEERARELTSAATSEIERVQAIGRFVQDVRYISIQTGVGRGGGYRPHAASEVFAKLYGDCKDKVTLMRAMLTAVGIGSYPVAVFSGDPQYVREEWPSPQQFNHMVIAVQMSAEHEASSILHHSELGNLLIFDPTDPNTPVGAVPYLQQDSFALVVESGGGDLLRLPSAPPEQNRTTRQVDARLDEGGGIVVSIREEAEGQEAADSLRLFNQLPSDEYVGVIERWVTRGARGANLLSIETESGRDGRFVLELEFEDKDYGQAMSSRLLVFNPLVVLGREPLVMAEAVREHPVVLQPLTYSDVIRIELPAGFQVDELPGPVQLEESFGSYATTYTVEAGYLLVTRTHTQHAATIPVKDYARVQDFFRQILGANQTPVVLMKQ